MILTLSNSSLWTKVFYVPIGCCRHLTFTVSALIMKQLFESFRNLTIGVNPALRVVIAFLHFRFLGRTLDYSKPRTIQS